MPLQETYHKFKANPPARIKRKAGQQRMEKEEAKRMREAGETPGGQQQQQQGQFQNPNAPPLQQQQQQVRMLPPAGLPPGANPPIQQNRPESDPNSGTQQQNGTHNPTAANGEVKTETTEGKESSSSASSDTAAAKVKTEDEEKENKAASSSASTQRPKVLMTGFVQSEINKLTACLNDLGAEIMNVTQSKSVTHVIMPALGRTISFMCSLPYCKWVLTKEWIYDCHKENKFIGN